MKNEVKIFVLLNTSDMYDFLLQHTYSNLSGVIGVALSLGSLIYLLFSFQLNRPSGNAILLVIGLLFTVINPFILLLKAKQQIRNNPIFIEPLVYSINRDEILVKQNSQQIQIDWEEINKVVETRRCIILYITSIRAYIFPKSNMKEEYEDFLNLIFLKVDKNKIKLNNKRVR